MAKFAYRMQSILDIKEKMEGQAKIAYGVANAKLMDEPLMYLRSKNASGQ